MDRFAGDMPANECCMGRLSLPPPCVSESATPQKEHARQLRKSPDNPLEPTLLGQRYLSLHYLFPFAAQLGYVAALYKQLELPTDPFVATMRRQSVKWSTYCHERIPIIAAWRLTLIYNSALAAHPSRHSLPF